MATRDIEAGRAHVIIRLRDQVTAGLKHVERSLSGFGRNFATLGAAITAGSAGALAFPLKMAADMEQMGIALEVLLGNADAAKTMLKGLADFAKATPFGLADVGENAKLLLAYGVSAQSVLPNLRMLGDVSLGNKERFDRLALAFGQTQAKSRLMGQEVLQLTEAGFNPLQEISRTTGVSMLELTDRMERGEISAAMLTNAFYTATSAGGRFAGGMDRMSSSALGMLAKLMDAVAFGLKPLGDAAVAILKPVVGFATDVASAFEAFAQKNQGLMKAVAGVLIGLVAFGGVLAGVGLAAIALSTIAGGLAVAWQFAFATLFAVFSPLGVLIGGLVLAIVTFRSQIASAFAAAAAYVQPLTAAFWEVWSIFQQAWTGILAALMSGDLTMAAGIAWMGFTAAAWTAADGIAQVVSKAIEYLGRFIPGVDAVKNYMTAAFSSIGRAILAGRWDLAGAIAMQKLRMAVQSGLDSVSLTWAATMTGLGAMWDFMVFGLGRSWAYVIGAWNNGVLLMKKGINGIVQGIDYLITSLKIAERQASAAMGDRFAPAMIEQYRKEFAERTEMRNKDLADQEASNKQAFNQRIAQQDQQLNRSLTGRVQAEQSVQNAQAQRRMQQQQQLAALESEAAKAYAQSGDPTLAMKAAEARAQLNEAVKTATEKPKDPAVKQLQQQASGGMRTVGSVTSSGTFSAAGAAASLGFNARPMEDTARNTRRLVTLAERVRARDEARFG
jgi:tape measure domain-containing protein